MLWDWWGPLWGRLVPLWGRSGPLWDHSGPLVGHDCWWAAGDPSGAAQVCSVAAQDPSGAARYMGLIIKGQLKATAPIFWPFDGKGHKTN